MKFCKDCRHFDENVLEYLTSPRRRASAHCAHPQSVANRNSALVDTSPIAGIITAPSKRGYYCFIERGPYSNHCGPEAKWWEAK